MANHNGALGGADPGATLPLDIHVCESPRIAWIELTSKCPFDCVFCSRRLRRGAGEHMDFGLFSSLARQLGGPEIVRLNYSGESIHYPHLFEAIDLASRTGAFVELVTAFASFPPEKAENLAASGLNRLTVSLHTLDEDQFRELYGFGSLGGLRRALAAFLAARNRRGGDRPILDFAFVAMERNLAQLRPIAAYAQELGAAGVSVCPVIRRDAIAARFESELEAGRLRPGFKQQLREALDAVAREFPGLRVQVSSPELAEAGPLDGIPRRWPGKLPPGARIFTCDQSPWDTVHILANGDVVACEVRDQVALGNLGRTSLREVWNGGAYGEFRRQYELGELESCRACVFKSAYIPGALQSAIDPRDGNSVQLLRGWHEPEDGFVWSAVRSLAVLTGGGKHSAVRIRGMLPPAADGNTLWIRCNGGMAGSVENRTGDPYEFNVTVPVAERSPVLKIEFATARQHVPSRVDGPADQRNLGFALVSLETGRFPAGAWWRSRGRLLPVEAALCLAKWVRSALRMPPRQRKLCAWRPGIDVIIPERRTPELLERCLASVFEAAASLEEPCRVVVVLNGSDPDMYRPLRKRFRAVLWIRNAEPLSFATAIGLGLEECTHDWVYLLNSDMALHPNALRELLPWRAPHVFAVASQILPADRAVRREETGWTGFRTSREGTEIFDLAPEDATTVRGHLYAGGGSSLFQRRILATLICRPDPYAPFYWEDVEWGVRAWREGFEVLFCPSSQAEHVRRATVSQFYSPQEVERVVRRNALRFCLRNELPPLPLADVRRLLLAGNGKSRPEAGSAREAVSLVRARLWNARAPARETHLADVTNKYYLRAHTNGHVKPTVMVVSPYAVYPPSHGGSRRIANLLRRLQEGFQLVLLTDEAGLYSAKALQQYSGASAVHAVGGRPDLEAGADRISRIRAHCHAALRRELTRIVDCYRPALVQIEFVELAGLVEERRSGTPWVLTLHDVLLNGDPSCEEDRFERGLMKKYDAIVACCEEDAALLDGLKVRVVPNGADTGGACGPPSSGRSLLFAGPFRYRPNREGIGAFLKTVYPKLLERVPGVEIHILGGRGAPATAARLECFQMPGVQVHDHQDDIGPWLERCALSINPLTGVRGSCVKVAESLAAGRVCVSTTEGARGFMDAGLTSLVTAARIEDFLGPISDLLLEEGLRHRMEKLTETARRSLDWARSAGLQTSLYEELIGNGRRR